MTISEYSNARVEWATTSEHGAVALRVDNQVAHFCEFTNSKGLMIAVAAGINGKRVDFTTSGESGGFWRQVIIKDVRG